MGGTPCASTARPRHDSPPVAHLRLGRARRRADPCAVYDVVSDVTCIGERSPECRSAAWEQGTPGAVGVVCLGRNRWGLVARWARRCVVTEAAPGRAFAFRTLPEPWDPTRRDSTTWRYELERVDGGTRVRHFYEITLLPMRAVYGRALPQHRDMRPQMRHNLEALRDQFVAAPPP